jgi:N-acetylglutamate synthase-like GNAT family acetyltransferase
MQKPDALTWLRQKKFRFPAAETRFDLATRAESVRQVAEAVGDKLNSTAKDHPMATSPRQEPVPLNIRRAEVADVTACGRICYDAFTSVNREYNFPPDFPSPEVAAEVIKWMFSHPKFYCIVAEQDGKIIGSNCLDERTPIAGVGPITVDPAAQNSGAGRQMMIAVMERAKERKFPSIRLIQAAFHARSMSLYAKLGFDVKEPLVVLQGPAIGNVPAGYKVRKASAADLAACDEVCRRVHGHDRSGEMEDAIGAGTAMLVERNGRVTGCASIIGFFGFAAAESNGDLQALIAASEAFAGPGFLLPTRNTELFRWCLGNGLRVVEPMTLMSAGLYSEPAGAFLPSIAF